MAGKAKRRPSWKRKGPASQRDMPYFICANFRWSVIPREHVPFVPSAAAFSECEKQFGQPDVIHLPGYGYAQMRHGGGWCFWDTFRFAREQDAVLARLFL